MFGAAPLVQKDSQEIVVRPGDVTWTAVCVCKKLLKSVKPFLRYEGETGKTLFWTWPCFFSAITRQMPSLAPPIGRIYDAIWVEVQITLGWTTMYIRAKF